MTPPFLISADEVNCLIAAYLDDSGFGHTAFVLRAEARLEKSPHSKTYVPRGELVELLSKALLYSEVEAHWKDNSLGDTCKNTFSILTRHVCKFESPAPPVTDAHPPPSTDTKVPLKHSEAPTEKRKAESPSDEPKGKRARMDDMDVDSVSSAAIQTKASTPAVSVPPDPASVPLPITAPPKPQPEDPSSEEKKATTLLSGHQAEVFVCAWNPKVVSKLATGSKDTTINIWNIKKPSNGGSLFSDPPTQFVHLSKQEQADITSLDWNSDGTLIAIGCYDSVLRVCTVNGELYFSHSQHKGAVFATRFSKSGKWLLTASLDGSVCIWHVPLKRLHKQFICHAACCLDVDWITEDTFASCGADRRIQVLNVDGNSPLRTFQGHGSEINMIKCNPRKTLLASCSDDRTARIWPVTDLHKPPDAKLKETVLSGHTHTVSSVLWCPTNTASSTDMLATASFDCTSRLWDVSTGECLHVFSEQQSPIYALSFCPNARMFATGSGNGWLFVYDLQTKKKLWTWYGGPERPGIFEIDWQLTETTNRMAIALQSFDVGLIDVTRVPALQPLLTSS